MLCAFIGDADRDPKKNRAFKPGSFDLFSRTSGEFIEANRENIELVKEVFVANAGAAIRPGRLSHPDIE